MTLTQQLVNPKISGLGRDWLYFGSPEMKVIFHLCPNKIK
jgi:hypothetical protein